MEPAARSDAPSVDPVPDRLGPYVRTWVWAAAVVGGAAVAVGSTGRQPRPVVVLAVLAVTVVANRVSTSVPIAGGGRRQISLEELGSMLAVLFLTPPWAIAVAVLSDLSSSPHLVRGGEWQKIRFNLASRTTGMAAASLLYRLLTGGGFDATPADLLAGLGAAVVLVGINSVALDGVLARLSGRSRRDVLHDEVPAHLVDLGIGSTGILAAVLVVTAPYALPFLLVPAVFDQFRVRVERERYELAVAKQQAEAANRAKDEFLSRTSHELRTPLNAILGFGQLLELDDDLSREARRSVAAILRSGRHLLGLIDEVLDISRIETGRLDLQLDAVPVEAVVAESIDLVRPLAVEHDITVRLETRRDDLHVTGDRQRLRQVLINLLSNAIKYNRPGGTVDVLVRRHGDQVGVEVRDTGLGIARQDLEKLFRPFERLDAADREIQGTGLGLTLSRQLVEAMGGTLAVASTVGTGSSFTVQLPVCPPAAESTPTVAAEERPPQGPVMAPSAVPRVVYIEDDPDNAELLRLILLRRRGIELTIAPDATVGLALLREQLPDLVLLDLGLPGMDGATALERIVRDPVLSRIPVVALSADAFPERIQQLRAAGAVDYLTKPIDVPELLEVVDRWAVPTEKRSIG
ncbi:MAG: response regulator [Actinobacteria bacterium]|nr:response regulator [Actinomycetota bacterium]